MTETTYDVVGIGNAIVDVISQEDDAFIERFDLPKGSMSLIDADRAVELYDALGSVTEASGGSAANTVAGVASFGGSAAFIGKVRDDHLGTVFSREMAKDGVAFDVAAATEGLPTARSMIVVTPDAERTMNTFLGASTTLYPSDIDADLVAASQYLYCEGYIWDVPVTKDAIRVAIDAARDAGRKVSFTLSDGFCVERHLDEWNELIDGPIDLLFGNEDELKILTGAASFDDAVKAMQGRCDVICATQSEKGSVIVTPDEFIQVDAMPVDQVIDTTGAGDMYAAGVLYGLTNGYSLADAGGLGSAAAAEVISHLGARPAVSLSTLL